MDAATRLDPERLSTGHEHATQTARIGSGRVVPVRQRHGLLSLTLVARKGGKPEPSFEATVLHRGFSGTEMAGGGGGAAFAAQRRR